MSTLVGHQVLQVNPTSNNVETSVLSVPVINQTGLILATCHLTEVIPNIVGGIANIFISAFVKDGQPNENIQLYHLHESGITSVTFTLVGNSAQAGGVGLVFAGL
jgi:hypothetical protein